MRTAMLKLPQKTIDLEGLPPLLASALEELIAAWKAHAGENAQEKKGTQVKFTAWPGTVKGALTRKVIYDYLGDRVR